MHVQHVVAADVVGHLADRFEKRQTLDVAHRAADLHDRDVHALRDAHDALLDLVGDVRHYLDRTAEVVAAAFLGDDGMVDPAGGVIAFLGQVQGGEPLVVAEVQIGLGAVVRHVDFPVLIGIHGAGIDVDVGVQLEERDFEAAAFEQVPDGGRGEAFPQGRNDAARDENEFAHACLPALPSHHPYAHDPFTGSAPPGRGPIRA
jgi:hypothetical protein